MLLYVNEVGKMPISSVFLDIGNGIVKNTLFCIKDNDWNY